MLGARMGDASSTPPHRSERSAVSTNGDSRDHVLEFIVAHGGATVAQICAALNFSDATVRRHLDRLAAAGLNTDRLVHQATGRPHRLYSATDSGVHDRRDHSEALAARLIGQIVGEQSRLDSVAEGVAEQVAADHRTQVPADAPLEERVANTVEALRTEGILDEWSRTADGFVLHNHGCPYRSAADSSDCVCESDRRAIEKLVGVDVRQVGSLARGDNACEFTVSAPIPLHTDRQNHQPANARPEIATSVPSQVGPDHVGPGQTGQTGPGRTNPGQKNPGPTERTRA